MKEDNVRVLPKFKKFNAGEVMDKQEITNMAGHYSTQIIHNLRNHGIEPDKKFFLDMNTVNEFLIASIMRRCGMHHPLQDFIDEVLEYREDLDEIKEKEVTEDDIS